MYRIIRKCKSRIRTKNPKTYNLENVSQFLFEKCGKIQGNFVGLITGVAVW